VNERLAAIAGIYEYPSRLVGGLSAWQIKAASARAALADAGLEWSDVDALYDASEAGDGGAGGGLNIAEYFGFNPLVIDTTGVGGSSYELHCAHAARAVASGQAKVALLTYGSTARSSAHAIGTGGAPGGFPTPAANMEVPLGLTLVGNYGLAAQRHMYEYGTTAEQLAEIAVATRAHAMRNPAAVAGLTAIGITPKQISVSDVVSSRLVADPLHVLDCCLITDGGGAVVIVAPEVARDIRKIPVWIVGTGVATEYLGKAHDMTVSAGRRSGEAAFGQAGIRPDEIDVAMIYDSFTITALTILEDLGFCKKGEGGAFVETGCLRFDHPDRPSINTDGGGLSSNHPGMRGIFLLIEATRQLRGESTSQLADPRLAVAHGNGGYLATRHCSGTVVLAKD
jgi:acetyl-CoA C-acetyltransferase